MLILLFFFYFYYKKVKYKAENIMEYNKIVLLLQ